MRVPVGRVVLGAGFLLLLFSSAPQPAPATPAQTAGPTALLIDQAAATDPNGTLVAEATELLRRAGYEVEVVSAPAVTLGLFQELPGRGADLVVVRAHSAVSAFTQSPIVFTSQQLTNWNRAAVAASYPGTELVRYSAWTPGPGSGVFFGVGANFVYRAMEGQFAGTTILMMGCNGMDTPSLGQAFLDRGAARYIAWNGSVLPDRTDSAIVFLLEAAVVEGAPWSDAVNATAARLGPDPVHGSDLRLMA